VIDRFPDAWDAVDLTHTLSPDISCYPGTEPPVFSGACTLETHGFAERRIAIYSHTGTHVDAPSHILSQGAALDDFGAGRFVGPGTALDLRGLDGPVIRPEDLAPFQSEIEGRDFLLLCTGWSGRWGRKSYYEAYPVLTPEAARWLAGFRPKAVGVDAISVDPMDTETFPVHRLLLERDILVIENLTRLEALLGREFLLCCLPLKIEAADGAPVRAVAFLPGR